MNQRHPGCGATPHMARTTIGLVAWASSLISVWAVAFLRLSAALPFLFRIHLRLFLLCYLFFFGPALLFELPYALSSQGPLHCIMPDLWLFARHLPQ